MGWKGSDLQFQNVIIQHIAIPDVGHLAADVRKSEMMVDVQRVAVVLIAGQPDFRKAVFVAVVFQKLQGLCAQMLSPVVLVQVKLAQKEGVFLRADTRITCKRIATENPVVFISLFHLIF